MKLKLKNPNSCDGCTNLRPLMTIGGHVRCTHYKKNMLPLDDVSMVVKKTGRVERPQICKDENEVEVSCQAETGEDQSAAQAEA